MSKLPPRTIHNLADLFDLRCRHQPEALAYALIRDTLELERQLTYGQLERGVRSLAGQLVRAARPGTHALLLYPEGLEAVCALWACVCAGLVPVPAPAPDPIRLKSGLPRLRAIIDDAQVSLVLTTSRIAALSSEFSIPNDLRPINWLATDQPYDQSIQLSGHGLTSTLLRTCNIPQGRRPHRGAS